MHDPLEIRSMCLLLAILYQRHEWMILRSFRRKALPSDGVLINFAAVCFSIFRFKPSISTAKIAQIFKRDCKTCSNAKLASRARTF